MKYEIVEAVRHIATTPCITKEQLAKSSRIIVSLMRFIPADELELIDPAVLAIYYRAKATIEEGKANNEGVDMKFKDFNAQPPIPPATTPFVPKPPEQRAKDEGWPEITKEEMKAAYGDEDEWSEGDIDLDPEDYDDEDEEDDDDDDGESWKKGPKPEDKE